jgi:putative endonuclease
MYRNDPRQFDVPAGSGQARRHYTGLAAEESAERFYRAEGGRAVATRWRCPEGEIDLVVAFPGEIVFAEVKARRRHAADAVSARQWARIGAAAARFLAEETDGALPCRFDLVLVDRSGAVERIENARRFDEW